MPPLKPSSNIPQNPKSANSRNPNNHLHLSMLALGAKPGLGREVRVRVEGVLSRFRIVGWLWIRASFFA